MDSVCLAIIFNHKYNQNIPILEKLYRTKFSSLYYIVPFYNENIKNIEQERIVPVYETSYCFQGYITQAYEKIKSKKYSHYIFIADDQILNPALNESTIIERMDLNEDESYIKEIVPYEDIRHGSLKDQSNKLYNILSAFNINCGVSYDKEIPSYDEAVKKCEYHHLKVSKKLPLAFFLNEGYINPKYFLLTLVALGINRGNKLKYPLFKAYSDMIIIDHHSIDEFCRLSGVFASMNIFVETAIPLAMILSCKKIKYEKDLKGLHGVEKWGKDIAKFEEKYELSLGKLFKNFEDDILYYHPVKLSKWKVE